MEYNGMKIRYAQISREKKEHSFSLRELNCKGELYGERILNGDVRHDTLHVLPPIIG